MSEACGLKLRENTKDLPNHHARPGLVLRWGFLQPVPQVAVRVVFHGNIRAVEFSVLVPTEHADDSDCVGDLSTACQK